MSRINRAPAEPRCDERGSVALELVLVVPVLVLVLCVLTAGWRLWTARTQVQQAASAAARAATLEREAGAARARAVQVAQASLQVPGLQCGDQRIDINLSGFSTAPGAEADVAVMVSCRIPLADLLVPGLPGSWQVQADQSHRLDTFRERRP
ncbi:pilus assembly protein [Luteococcus sediminum]|uniref:TadE/TadG family type IV pilus assembly protein n=1 Tax=Luteococcus sp. TaxID=1969402 RepID=UPI0037365351